MRMKKEGENAEAIRESKYHASTSELKDWRLNP